MLFVDGDLSKLNVPLIEDLASKYGTPLYLYDMAKIDTQLKSLRKAFDDQKLAIEFHYSVKANSNLALLTRLRERGCAFDVVSGGELKRCLRIGATGQEIVFAGVGKTTEEVELALEAGIRQFNVESVNELEHIKKIARAKGQKARVALRINPDIDALTHEYITTGTHNSKFGISIDEASLIYLRERTTPDIEWVGLDMHIGSQLTDETPILLSLKRYAAFVKSLSSQGLHLQNLDIGGGLGIAYRGEKVIPAARFAELVAEGLSELDLKKHTLILEPGRFLVGEAGLLITRVQHLKRQQNKRFAIADAGMTELLRPALYGAYHEISLVTTRTTGEATSVDVVGPICESSDSFAKDRLIPELERGDLLALRNCGAYASSMSHTYNTRGRAPELLVENGQARLIRRRETFDDLVRLETEVLP
ncbi:MAG: diaminopimelate decarboxylase [Bdellovibrionota bacterium]